ncbi:predicted protein [Naegleria gruberi]|uniref:Predicted protein n=1 Tax=Naegleria gruberi TaxID=5762 RepID=D2VCF5_NAEGR|nr:uncharacterized protein NAEGRDRAFT_66553 [Naegleria gruberi]EFC45297.1 predicted protein [Naegleria gruberi]|eukprot:XP_002678041.1 predicted protein [Naegleria gruberi strain NEG-M]
MNVWITIAALAALVLNFACVVEANYPMVEASVIALNSTGNGTTPFVYDFWRINKPPIIGGIIVLVVGVIIAIIGGGIYYWKKRRDARQTQHDEHEDMHRLEDEDH